MSTGDSGSEGDPGNAGSWSLVNEDGDVESSCESVGSSSSSEFVQVGEDAVAFHHRSSNNSVMEQQQQEEPAPAEAEDPLHAMAAETEEEEEPEVLETVDSESVEVLSSEGVEEDFSQGGATEADHHVEGVGEENEFISSLSKKPIPLMRVAALGRPATDSDSDSDFIRLERFSPEEEEEEEAGCEAGAEGAVPAAMEYSTSSMSTSSISSSFRFVHPVFRMQQLDSPPRQAAPAPNIPDDDSLLGDVDDRVESDISGVVPDDTDLSNVSYSLGDLPLTAGVRVYRYRPNQNLNATLNIIALVALFLGIGIGVGHFIGSMREGKLRDTYVGHLRTLQDDYLVCLKTNDQLESQAEDIQQVEDKWTAVVDTWKQQYEELVMERAQMVRFQASSESVISDLRNQVNQLKMERYEMLQQVAQLRYSQHPGNQDEAVQDDNSIKSSDTENTAHLNGDILSEEPLMGIIPDVIFVPEILPEVAASEDNIPTVLEVEYVSIDDEHASSDEVEIHSQDVIYIEPAFHNDIHESEGTDVYMYPLDDDSQEFRVPVVGRKDTDVLAVKDDDLVLTYEENKNLNGPEPVDTLVFESYHNDLFLISEEAQASNDVPLWPLQEQWQEDIWYPQQGNDQLAETLEQVVLSSPVDTRAEEIRPVPTVDYFEESAAHASVQDKVSTADQPSVPTGDDIAWEKTGMQDGSLQDMMGSNQKHQDMCAFDSDVTTHGDKFREPSPPDNTVSVIISPAYFPATLLSTPSVPITDTPPAIPAVVMSSNPVPVTAPGIPDTTPAPHLMEPAVDVEPASIHGQCQDTASAQVLELQQQLDELHEDLMLERRRSHLWQALYVAERVNQQDKKLPDSQPHPEATSFLTCLALLVPDLNSTAASSVFDNAVMLYHLWRNATDEVQVPELITTKWDEVKKLTESAEFKSFVDQISIAYHEVEQHVRHKLQDVSSESVATKSSEALNKFSETVMNISRSGHLERYLNLTRETVSRLNNTIQNAWTKVRSLSADFLSNPMENVRKIHDTVKENVGKFSKDVNKKLDRVQERIAKFLKVSPERNKRKERSKRRKQSRKSDNLPETTAVPDFSSQQDLPLPVHEEAIQFGNKLNDGKLEDKPVHKQKKGTHEHKQPEEHRAEIMPEDLLEDGFFEGNQREWRKHQKKLKKLHGRIFRLNEDMLTSMDDDDIEDLYDDLEDFQDDLENEWQPERLKTWLACQVRWWKGRFQRKHRNQDFLMGCSQQLMNWQLRALCKLKCSGKKCRSAIKLDSPFCQQVLGENSPDCRQADCFRQPLPSSFHSTDNPDLSAEPASIPESGDHSMRDKDEPDPSIDTSNSTESDEEDADKPGMWYINQGRQRQDGLVDTTWYFERAEDRESAHHDPSWYNRALKERTMKTHFHDDKKHVEHVKRYLQEEHDQWSRLYNRHHPSQAARGGRYRGNHHGRD